MDGMWSSYRMGKLLSLMTTATVLALAAPPAYAFWWGLTEEEQQICESRASIERTDFAARQAYERCKKTIKAEIREKEERKARQEAEAAAAAAAEQAAIQKLTPGIERRCLFYLPEIKALNEEVSGDNLKKYLKEKHSFEARMTKMYGKNYSRLSNYSNLYSDYPDYVMDQFPWIKWYRGISAKEWELQLKMIGHGVKREEITTSTWLYDARKEGCSKTAKSIAKWLFQRGFR